MRIIQLIYSLASGGGERFVVDLSNQLAQLGHDLTICILLDDSLETNVFNKQFIDKGVKFYSFKFKPGFSLGKVLEVERFLKTQMPDVVHCHLNVIPYIYRLTFTNKKINFIHTLHSVASATCGGRGQWRINKFFYKKGYIQPVAISSICKESYERFYNLHNAPCIDNGRSLVLPSANFYAVKKEVESLKIDLNTKVFIHVARCHPLKNQVLLIDAFNELYNRGENFVLLILGNGFDKSEGRLLKQRACSKIQFLGEKNNVGDYLLCSDAFCLSSNYEGLPISLLEALSCGLTPICTPVGGIPDVINDNVNGYLSNDLSVDSYVNAICRFISAPIEKRKLIEFYKDHYSIEKCANEYINKVYLKK